MIDHTTPGHLLVRGDSARLPIASGSVHACITSPPFFALRAYPVPPTRWGATSYVPMPGLPPVEVPAMACSLGLEPDPWSYVGHIVLIFREVRRVLRDDGCCWVNWGDSYNAYNGNRGKSTSFQERADTFMPDLPNGHGLTAKGLKPTDLIGLPWRCAFALQADGWYLRSAPPWVKPGSAMPESCRSRPNVAHEMIFMFTKSSSYYFDMNSVRRASAPATLGRDRHSRVVKAGAKSHIPEGDRGNYGVQHDHETISHPAGRHWRTSDLALDSLDLAIAHHAARLAELEAARDAGGLLADDDGHPEMFLVNPRAYAGAHFASWNPALVAPMIKCSTSEAGCCPACGAGWERVVEREVDNDGYPNGPGGKKARDPRGHGTTASSTLATVARYRTTTLGFRPACPCPPADPVPSLVLDPFSGSGGTGAAALALGRRYVGVDLAADYRSLARERILDTVRPHKVKPRSRRGRPAGPDAAPLLAHLEDD